MCANFVIKVFFLLYILKLSHCTKWLIDNPGFNNPEAWQDENLPCSLEEVVFPENYPAVLPLPDIIDVSGFILPTEGAILLSQDSTITLGGDLKTRSCENGGDRKAYLKEPQTKKWYDPQSWRTTTAMSKNDALPHMERVPCANDSLVIQRNGPISLDLENVPYLRLGQLSLAGSLVSKDYLENLLNTPLGQILFHNAAAGAKVQYYHNDICGCQMNYEKFVEPICHNVVDTCPRPHCRMPIDPSEDLSVFGSCCAICGAVLRFSVQRCEDGNYNKLRKVISMEINKLNLADDLDYHVSYINTVNQGNFLQAIIVDRNGYSEKSVAFVDQLILTTDWKKLFAAPHQLYLMRSGRPYNPNITFGSVVLIIMCLLLVSFVALVIFAHYEPENRYLRYVPQWVYDPRRWRSFLLQRRVMFARFDNSAAAVAGSRPQSGIRESIIMGYDAESGRISGHPRAFDNPMFGETRRNTDQNEGKQTKADEKPISSVDINKPEATLETGTIVNVTADSEEQELTEIKLESDDDSEAEQETRE